MQPVTDRGLPTGVHERPDGRFAVLLVSYGDDAQFDPEEFPFASLPEALAFVRGVEVSQEGRLDVASAAEFRTATVARLAALAERNGWATPDLEECFGIDRDRTANGGAAELIGIALAAGDDPDWVAAALRAGPA